MPHRKVPRRHAKSRRSTTQPAQPTQAGKRQAKVSLPQSDLDHLLAEIRSCRICRDQPRKKSKPLPHEPNPVLRVSGTAKICICGQAPGTKVHVSGIPFTDPSGLRLRQWMGVSEQEFYDVARIAIIPMGFCFPGQNSKGADLPPRRECRENWHRDLFAVLAVQFELLLLVGRYAQVWHLGSSAMGSLTQCVRDWRRFADVAGGQGQGQRSIYPLPHPSWRNNAWIKKNSWFEAELVMQLQHHIRSVLDQPTSG